MGGGGGERKRKERSGEKRGGEWKQANTVGEKMLACL